jgi:L-ascorbate metabolism protein UlaG (beta-lactamase superfamily)
VAQTIYVEPIRKFVLWFHFCGATLHKNETTSNFFRIDTSCIISIKSDGVVKQPRKDDNILMPNFFRWLGTAGLEFCLDGHTLLIDPFFSRPPAWAVLLGHGRRPDPALVARYAPRCQHVLVTHPHYDHLLDVPEVMRQTGARASGSANTCALLGVLGQPPERLDCLALGDQRQIGPWRLEVHPAWHVATPLDVIINGPLPAKLSAPPHLLDYRMDACFSYLLEGGGQRLLIGNSLTGDLPAAAVDTAFITPFVPARRLRSLLQQARPHRVAAIHWDNFSRPLSQPLRPIPFIMLRLRVMRRFLQQSAPGCRLLVPELFKPYPLGLEPGTEPLA